MSERAEDYRQSHTRAGMGKSYHKQFIDGGIRSVYWKLEKSFLKRVVLPQSAADWPLAVLDFACGTGRVAGFLHSLGCEVVGVDISQSMLQAAESFESGPTYLQIDLTRESLPGEISPRQDKFDVVTAFRFFPNAQPELRLEGIRALAPLVRQDGLLLISHHRNPKSIWRRLSISFGGPKCDLDNSELVKLIESHGFRLHTRRSIGFLPLRHKWKIPFRVVWLLEKTLTAVLGRSKLGQTNLYCFVKE
jgi:SAM-dependent methyltransferase